MALLSLTPISLVPDELSKQWFLLIDGLRFRSPLLEERQLTYFTKTNDMP